MNKAYESFSQKLMSVIDKLASFKTKRVKGNSQEWFDSEVLESIALRDKLFKKFKRSKLNLEKEIYNKARNKSHRLILQSMFQNSLRRNSQVGNLLEPCGVVKSTSNDAEREQLLFSTFFFIPTHDLVYFQYLDYILQCIS